MQEGARVRNLSPRRRQRTQRSGRPQILRTFWYTAEAHIVALGTFFQSIFPALSSGSGAPAQKAWNCFTAEARCASEDSDEPEMGRLLLTSLSSGMLKNSGEGGKQGEGQEGWFFAGLRPGRCAPRNFSPAPRNFQFFTPTKRQRSFKDFHTVLR